MHTRTNTHMVDVSSTHPPTYPHYTFQPCHLTLSHHSLTLLSTSSSQLTSPNLNLPVTTPSHLRRPSWSTTQSQHAWGDQSSTHRWLTYLSGSRSTSWVGRKYCLCVLKHDTHIHMHVCSGTSIEDTELRHLIEDMLCRPNSDWNIQRLHHLQVHTHTAHPSPSHSLPHFPYPPPLPSLPSPPLPSPPLPSPPTPGRTTKCLKQVGLNFKLQSKKCVYLLCITICVCPRVTYHYTQEIHTYFRYMHVTVGMESYVVVLVM